MLIKNHVIYSPICPNLINFAQNVFRRWWTVLCNGIDRLLLTNIHRTKILYYIKTWCRILLLDIFWAELVNAISVDTPFLFPLVYSRMDLSIYVCFFQYRSLTSRCINYPVFMSLFCLSHSFVYLLYFCHSWNRS